MPHCSRLAFVGPQITLVKAKVLPIRTQQTISAGDFSRAGARRPSFAHSEEPATSSTVSSCGPNTKAPPRGQLRIGEACRISWRLCSGRKASFSNTTPARAELPSVTLSRRRHCTEVTDILADDPTLRSEGAHADGALGFRRQRSTEADQLRALTRTTPSRQDDGLRIHALPERGSLRAGIGTTLARACAHIAVRPSREPVRDEARLYHLRDRKWSSSERVGDTGPCSWTTCRPMRDVPCPADVASLERQGLIETRTATRLRDGAVADVVSVTHAVKPCSTTIATRRGTWMVVRAGWVYSRKVA
jgi:hypothetical protein